MKPTTLLGAGGVPVLHHIVSVRQVCKVHRNPLDLGRSSGSQRPSPLNRAENITLVYASRINRVGYVAREWASSLERR